jgi:hypothetical protein
MVFLILFLSLSDVVAIISCENKVYGKLNIIDRHSLKPIDFWGLINI